ncbi:Uu.00g141710.m01.CDS01 [Anthostomella pinea]|uniref:Uu.00g141710.m01.CDS01 n=1 Tax=Anthostomella pinea TaxID=933095 RepID=A0AAI8VJV7_9PEZI|nr:Uu.00g141710.m01.CDS01 [Anthostomella pinea]
MYPTLFELVHATCGAAATDVRDRVYSLLGLVDPRESEQVGVDYEAPTWKVFAAATSVAITATRSLDILQLSALANPGERGAESFAAFNNLDLLPSWATLFSRESSLRFKPLDEYILWSLSEFEHRTDPTMSADCSFLTCWDIDLASVTCAHKLEGYLTGEKWRFSGGFDAVVALMEETYSSLLTNIRPSEAGATSIDPHRVRVVPSGYGLVMPPLGEAKAGYATDQSIVAYLESWEKATRVVLAGSPHRLAAQKLTEMPPHVDYTNHTRYCLDGQGIEPTGFRPMTGEASFFATENGFIGLARGLPEPGDRIVLIERARLPLMLRKSGKHWEFRGFVSVPNIMEYELHELWTGFELPLKEYVLC